jgi:hypothetical protein
MRRKAPPLCQENWILRPSRRRKPAAASRRIRRTLPAIPTAARHPKTGEGKRPGYGRNGAKEYVGAAEIEVPHESLKSGDPCPVLNCEGRVYRLADPAVLVRIVGNSPLCGTVIRLERLRCNLCLSVFTAKAPEGAGEEKYVDVVADFPEECRFVLETLAEVFKNDATARKEGMSPKERLELHRRESLPLMAKLRLWTWKEIKERRVEPNSGLGKAIQYMRKHWRKLVRFL